MAIRPIVSPYDPEQERVRGVRSGLYFRESGLERWLVLISPSEDEVQELSAEFGSLSLDPVEGISVALPEGAEGREVEAGATIVPDPVQRVKNVLLFAGHDVRGRGRIELKYVVPASAAQVAISDNGVKFLVALAVPIATLLFLPPKDIARPQFWRTAVYGGISIQVALVAFLIWAAISTGRLMSAGVVMDLLAGVLATGGEIAVLRAKQKA